MMTYIVTVLGVQGHMNRKSLVLEYALASLDVERKPHPSSFILYPSSFILSTDFWANKGKQLQLVLPSAGASLCQVGHPWSLPNAPS